MAELVRMEPKWHVTADLNLHLYLEAAQIPRRKCQKKKVEGLTREAVKALMDAPDPLRRT